MRTLKREHTLLPESSSDETENQEERCRDGEEMDSPKIRPGGDLSVASWFILWPSLSQCVRNITLYMSP